jgi:tRNA1(Val) A37 N6-methylase TrmN6
MTQDHTLDPAEQIEVSRDTLFDGEVICSQHVDGYRFSIDSVLLAHFPRIRKKERILDLGSGCGVIGLILCYRHADKQIHVTGIEAQTALVRLARANISANGYEDRYSITEGNLQQYRSLLKPEAFSVVIANPPFFVSGTGRVSRTHEKNTARHQREGGLNHFVEAASFGVKNRGRVVFVFPADQSASLIGAFQHHRLAPKRMQIVYSYPGIRRASLVLVEAVKNGGTGLEILDPLYMYRYRNGPYARSVGTMFQPV